MAESTWQPTQQPTVVPGALPPSGATAGGTSGLDGYLTRAGAMGWAAATAYLSPRSEAGGDPRSPAGGPPVQAKADPTATGAADSGDGAGVVDETTAAVAAATADIPNQDVLYERMAHGFVYDGVSGADVGKLRVWGYAAGPAVEGQYGFRMMSFVPIPDATEAQKAALGAALRPVLAFRGTANLEGAIDDANPAGVGRYQFAANEPAIQGALAGLQAHGKVDVIGHSLGGALAQITACAVPGAIGRVVTFQSPGIPAEMAQDLDAYNAAQAASGGDQVTSTHHRVTTDVVSMAGEAYTTGDVVAYDLGSAAIGTAGGHTANPLADLTDASGNARVAGVGPADGERTVQSVERYQTGSTTQGHESDLEGARREAGSIAYNETGDEKALYVNLWETLKPKLATGRLLLPDYDAIVAGTTLSSSNQALLRLNARELFPELNESQKQLDRGATPDALLDAVVKALGPLDAVQVERVQTYGRRYVERRAG